jgi:hypothetical protein
VSCYRRNQPLLDRVWDRLDDRFRHYPAPLRTLAGELVRTLGPRPRRYFSGPDAAPILHLPIWAAGPASRRALPILLEASALAYLYVRIQDNVIDEPVTRGRAPHLLLGNVLLGDAIALLARFVQSPRVWDLARSAWTLFSSETESERRQLAANRGYGAERFRRNARKVALARVPLYAVLAREGRLDRKATARIDTLVDKLGEAYGLVNDVLGCPRDLQSGAHTYLLASARATLAKHERTDASALRLALATHPLFEAFLARAMRIHARALPIGLSLGLHAMTAFTEERRARIAWHLRRVTTLRLAMALAPRATGQ